MKSFQGDDHTEISLEELHTIVTLTSLKKLDPKLQFFNIPKGRQGDTELDH